MQLIGLTDLCVINYVTVNHGMLSAFVKRWHWKTSSFNLLHSEMSITLDDVSCLLHLSIRGILLDHDIIIKDEVVEMIVDYLGVNPRVVIRELEVTWGCHARFRFMKRLYTEQLHAIKQTTSNDKQVMQHKAYALRAYMLYFVGTSIFVDKSVTYVDAVYPIYFTDLEWIHEYN